MREEDEQRRRPRGHRTVWGELALVCRRIHHWWYVRGEQTPARRYQRRLERLLRRLPQNDCAIVREEGLAWLSQLKGELNQALGHRRREVELMERLHASVQRSVERGEYDRATAEAMLDFAGRGHEALGGRRAIVRALEDELKRNGTATGTQLGRKRGRN
jgi:hypothetical protein